MAGQKESFFTGILSPGGFLEQHVFFFGLKTDNKSQKEK